jgi:hypothetical protein
MARNYFQDPLETGENAFDRGFDRQQGVTDRITTVRAGRQLASGDRVGAAKTFAGGGMIDQSRRMTADQQADDDRAYERGNIEQDRETKMKAQQAQALIKIAEGLRSVPAGQRAAALQQSLPIFQQIGIDPTPFAGLTEQQLTDDQLGLFAGEVQKHYQVINRGNGGYDVMDMRTGQKAGGVEPDMRPVVIGNGGVAVDPETKQVIGRNPKTFAPSRARAGGGRSGGGGIPNLPPGFVMEK